MPFLGSGRSSATRDIVLLVGQTKERGSELSRMGTLGTMCISSLRKCIGRKLMLLNLIFFATKWIQATRQIGSLAG
jgi:hypothetical protein